MNHKRFLGAASAALMIVIVIFALVPGVGAQTKYKTLYKFKGGKDGNQPVAALVFDTTGNLYGTTEYGGANKAGTVFKVTPSSGGGWTETVIYSFTGGVDGGRPVSSLIFDQAGNLYGTSQIGGDPKCYYGNGCGVVFKLTPNSNGSWTESVLYNFTGGSDGMWPYASVIFDTAGNLYGTTNGGGIRGCGVVYKLTPGGDGPWTESVLGSFQGQGQGREEGCQPFSGLTFDAMGSLYSTTGFGGKRICCGTVFKLAPNSDGSWTESVLHTFGLGIEFGVGKQPHAGVIFDSAGSLYGTTSLGGKHGVVFKLTPNSDGSWTEVVLHTFTGKDGRAPRAGLVFDPAGNLYGTTRLGGRYNHGVVYELVRESTGGWTYHVVHAFMGHPGALPYAGVTIDAAGNLYGTTKENGKTAFGSVFEITP